MPHKYKASNEDAQPKSARQLELDALRQAIAGWREKHGFTPANDDIPGLDDLDALARVRKVSRKRARSSYRRSRKDIAILDGYVADIRMPGAVPSVGEAHPTKDTPSSLSKHSFKPRVRTRIETDKRRPSAWRYLTETGKLHAYLRSVSPTGEALAVTVNFGDTLTKAANDNPGSVKKLFQDRLARALKSSSLRARDYVLVLDVSPAGRLHLHGAVDARPAERKALEAVLKVAAGKWDAPRGSDRQIHTQPMRQADGWARYDCRNRVAVQSLIGDQSIMTVSRGCNQRAKALYEAARVATNEVDRSVTTDLHLALGAKIIAFATHFACDSYANQSSAPSPAGNDRRIGAENDDHGGIGRVRPDGEGARRDRAEHVVRLSRGSGEARAVRDRRHRPGPALRRGGGRRSGSGWPTTFVVRLPSCKNQAKCLKSCER